MKNVTETKCAVKSLQEDKPAHKEEIYEIRNLSLIPYLLEACMKENVAFGKIVTTETGKGIKLKNVSHRQYRRILARAHGLQEERSTI